MKKIHLALITAVLVFSATKNFAQNIATQRTMIGQIQLLMQEKASRTPAQRKMDSQLLQAAREKNGQQMVAGVTLSPIRLKAGRNANANRVLVDIKATLSDGLLNKIEALGGKIIYPSWEYHTIRAEINISSAETIAGYPEVVFIRPAIGSATVSELTNTASDISQKSSGLFNSINNDIAVASDPHSLSARASRLREQVKQYLLTHANIQSPFIGSVTTEGDRTHRTDEVRNVFGYAGQGIKIGVISDSYNAKGGAAADVASGDLPGTGNPNGNTTPVTVVEEGTGQDEGRAMLQIVHDIAPKAQLFFADGGRTEAGFATNIKLLQSTYQCDIIIDDVIYFDEPPFQDGIVAQAVNTVTNAGVFYFSSSGNFGSVAKGTAGYFQGDFNDAGSTFTVPGTSKTGTIHNFGTVSSPVNGDIMTKFGHELVLHWDDPMGNSTNDYDLFIVSSSGAVRAAMTNIQNGPGSDPFEIYGSSYTLSAGDRLVVFKTTTAAVRAFAINTFGGTLTVGSTGESSGHSTAVDGFSIAAAPAFGSYSSTPPGPTGPYPNVFSASSVAENFSSEGPRRIFYNADGTPVTPGNILFATNGGVVRKKPDFTAADGVTTTFSLTSGFNPFHGTSAAAPHAGAIAALLKSAKPSLTITELKNIFTNTALDIELPGYDSLTGYGIIQAYQAMQALNPARISNISLGTITASEGSYGNGNGFVEAGELGKIVIQLNNTSLVNATGITATISTTATGITMVQSSTAYGTIAASGSASNSGAPFIFGVGQNVACGTVINFVLTVSFGGGGASPQNFPFSITIGNQPGANISAVLGTPATGPGFTSVTGTQTGRIVRTGDNTVSVCGTSKTNPGLTTATGSRAYDAYTFTNTNATNQCVTITMKAANGVNLYTVVYNKNGFIPATPNTNYLADQGSSTITQSFGFTAPAGQTFTVVVHAIDIGGQVGSPYTLSVSLSNCTAGPACTPVSISTTSIANGTLSLPYAQSFQATGGSGNYIYSLTGTIPSGIALSGATLSGTPTIAPSGNPATTQIGNYSLTLTATDVVGCPADSKNFTLRLLPGSFIATAGTPQTTTPGSAFGTALQVTVLDGLGAPVPNAIMGFSAPTTGARATFPGSQTNATVFTNSNGVATAPALTANNTIGSYTVTATLLTLTANFALTNANCSMSCPANITVNNDPGKCGAVVNFGTITSTCGTITTVPASGSFFPIGSTTVTATSSSGPTCSFIVQVNDTQAPVINCPANIVVNTTAGQCSAVVNYTLPTATDNCFAVTVTGSPASGSVFQKGVTTVTLTAKDAANNVTTCTFTVTVNDAEPPVISNCPGDITVNALTGQCRSSVNFGVPTVTDNCPGATITTTTASGSFFPVGVNTVTYTATDASGNTATCSFKITVKSIDPPVINCPANMVVNTDAAQCGAVVTFNLPVATGCSGVTVTASPASGSFFAKGTTTITCTAKDASNNTSTCTFTITVKDNEPPVITCPANINAKTDAGKCTAVVNYSATVTDNCPDVTVAYSPASGSVFPIGTTPVTVTATDASGNQKTCSFNVIVTDAQPAVITGQSFDTTVCVGQNAGAVVAVASPASFQWQINTGSGFTNITGATGNVLNLNNVSLSMNGNLYRVAVSSVCSSVTSVPAKLVVVPIPTIALAASPLNSLKPGETTTITATTTPATGGSLLWSKDNIFIAGAVSRILPSIGVDGIGLYKVIYTNICTVTSNTIAIGATASDNMFMYPNPTTGRFQLRYYTPVNELLTLTITDFKGARVYHRQVTTSGPYTEIDVDISRNGSGVYAVELRNKDNVVVGIKKIFLGH